MTRKLAAVLAGDIVGYSRLMAEDEAATYAELRVAFDDVIHPAIDRHRGHVFKNTGDGFLAAFQSVNDALDAAVDIQTAFDSLSLTLRMGLNLGDIIEKDDDVFGDGVNVAARLEAMAEPGSIYASAAVVRSVDRNRVKSFRRIGKRTAKNLPDAIDVYAFNRAHGEGRSLPRWMIMPRVRPRQIAFAAIAMVSVSAMAALAFTDSGSQIMKSRSIMAIARMVGFEQGDMRPSVAILPFDNLSGDPEQTYFADGLTEDIITELARYPDLQVIARNSTFVFRGQPTDIREVGQKLGADYVVEGSARRAGEKIRVVTQLINAKSGAHIWSRSYDRELQDVFTVQRELTSEIVSHLSSYVRATESVAASHRPTENMQAYDLVLRARNLYKHGSSEPNAIFAARTLFQRAIELDPQYAAAYAYLGINYVAAATRGPVEANDRTGIDAGLNAARRAVQLDPNLAVGYQALSFGLSASGDYEGGMLAATRAVELNPNEPDSLIALAKAQVRFGNYSDAVDNAERARRLHPMAPEYYTYVYGQALYAANRPAEASTVLKECLARAPQDANCLLILTAALSQLGERDEAQATMARLRDVNPDYSLQAERNYRRFGTSQRMTQFLSDLELASGGVQIGRREGAA